MLVCGAVGTGGGGTPEHKIDICSSIVHLQPTTAWPKTPPSNRTAGVMSWILTHAHQIQTALVALTATLAAAVPSLEIKGSDFVNSKTGDKFEIVGVAYQPGGSAGYDPEKGEDPLSHGDSCMRDAALMQILGINTIRVYNLDPDINHDECASIFNAVRCFSLCLCLC